MYETSHKMRDLSVTFYTAVRGSMALLQVRLFFPVTILSVCLATTYIQVSINFAVPPEGNLCVRRRALPRFTAFPPIRRFIIRRAKRSHTRVEISRHPIYVARSQKLFLAVGHWQERPAGHGPQKPVHFHAMENAPASGVRSDNISRDYSPFAASNFVFIYIFDLHRHSSASDPACIFDVVGSMRWSMDIARTGINKRIYSAAQCGISPCHHYCPDLATRCLATPRREAIKNSYYT